MDNNEEYFVISGKINGKRIESRILEEKLQKAVESGHRRIKVNAFGQHGIGGRLWRAGGEPVEIVVEGHSGQRVGSMGFPNTVIELTGPASDDVGWLNSGAEIVIHGHASNGVANAMAQGKIYVSGNIGSRGMTMTKRNPRFDPPELWVLGSVGDYFGEFMAGGVAVICGVAPQDRDDILGYRPFVGMVGGSVFFRGPYKGFSRADSKIVDITDSDWNWLTSNLEIFTRKIGKPELLETLSDRSEWRLIKALTPLERGGKTNRAMSDFRKAVWEKDLGTGGLIGDLVDFDRGLIPVITTGDLRRYKPVWENRKYDPPCAATCPTGIPVHRRWRLIREGKVDEAVALALEYTPFPASVCGYLCPNLCMQSCTRESAMLPAVDVTLLGKESIKAGIPEIPKPLGGRVAVIGGGPAGVSTAWQLRIMGHEAVIYDMAETLGGKLASAIPEDRIPPEVLSAELERVKAVIPNVGLEKRLSREDVEKLKSEFDYVVLATGAQKPRVLDFPGKERMITSLDFLRRAKKGNIKPGERMVIIGAGNVGCDVAAAGKRLGAESLLLIDVQEPASFGKERKHAEDAGAEFRWPCFTREITEQGVVLSTGELIPADMVVIAIGDAPDLDFLPDSVATDAGYVLVDENFRTSDEKVFAVGDMVRPGLLTDSIGSGRGAAQTVHKLLAGGAECNGERDMIDRNRVKTEYFDPRLAAFDDIQDAASQCASCGDCRDCGICIEICPRSAISRTPLSGEPYEYVVHEDRCIGCGFCVGACPCGVWNLIENFGLM